jgi:hypothetical protein
LNVDPPFHARFAGLDWSSDLRLDQFDTADFGAPDAIVVNRQCATRIAAVLKTIGRATIAADGVRFDCADEISFDLRAGTSIGWVPGKEWRGQLPVSFYSSVAAITLAMRGMLPLHASSVVLGEKAWLIAGNSGAGKSTLTAELLQAGAELLADDLTPITLAPHALAWRGRPAMRLHPATCEGMATNGQPEQTDDERGKLLIRPLTRAADKCWPVGGILFLGDAIGEQPSPEQKAMAFGSILFRPKIVTALPNRAKIREGLLGLARSVPMVLLPQVRHFDARSQSERVERALAAINRLAAIGLRS